MRAEAKAVRRGFAVKCPYCSCGAEDNTITLRLGEVTADDAFSCSDCGVEFSARELREIVDGWSSLLAWIGGAPELPAEEG